MKNSLSRNGMERDLFREALGDALKSEAGRKLIYMLLNNLGDGMPLYYGGNAEINAFAAGRRSVADELLMNIRSIEGGLELELKMRKEARADPKADEVDNDWDKMIGGEGLAY